MPRVLNHYRDAVPQDAVWVMRPSKWGNPFVIGRDGDRETVIQRYIGWLIGQPKLMQSLHELQGKDLVCCCSPKLCHADVLLELANHKF